MHQPTTDITGILPVWKPPGWSSARYIYLLRPILDVRRIGHAGTLDPFAQGVLLACIGRPATRLTETLMDLPKRYVATLQLGVTNACHDVEQPLEPVPNAPVPTLDEVRAILPSFRGRVRQTPPVYSAVKIHGKPAHRRVRQDQQIEVPARLVRIYALELVEYAWPHVTLDVLCGRGTYIRALARDIGDILGTGAVCVALRRTSVGPFEEPSCLRLDRDTTRQQALDRLIGVERAKQIVAAYQPPDICRDIPPAPAGEPLDP